MTFAMLFLLSVQPFASPTSPRSSPQTSPTANPMAAFAKIFGELLSPYDKLWENIGNDQAISTTQEVTSQANNLLSENYQLRLDMDNNAITADKLQRRISQLMSELQNLKMLLSKFSNEIDAAAHNQAQEIRGAADRLGDDKYAELRKVEDTWSRSHKEAEKHLDLATSYLQAFTSAAGCLANTVKNQKLDSRPDCAPDAIKKSISEAESQALLNSRR